MRTTRSDSESARAAVSAVVVVSQEAVRPSPSIWTRDVEPPDRRVRRPVPGEKSRHQQADWESRLHGVINVLARAEGLLGDDGV